MKDIVVINIREIQTSTHTHVASKGQKEREREREREKSIDYFVITKRVSFSKPNTEKSQTLIRTQSELVVIDNLVFVKAAALL